LKEREREREREREKERENIISKFLFFENHTNTDLLLFVIITDLFYSYITDCSETFLNKTAREFLHEIIYIFKSILIQNKTSTKQIIQYNKIAYTHICTL